MKQLLILLCIFGFQSVMAATDLETLVAAQTQEQRTLGQKRYEKYCIACHDPSNIMVSSPKLGDRADWSERLKLAGSLKQLVKNAKNGKNAMPAKGLCTECNDKDLSAAILYMMKGL